MPNTTVHVHRHRHRHHHYHHAPAGTPALTEMLALLAQLKEIDLSLSPRAQAIVDRITALSSKVTTDIANTEAAHDAANAAAEDADDTAVEGALSTLETSVGATPASNQAPLPAAA